MCNGCVGYFICDATNEVNRCDACAKFSSDYAAAQFVRTLLTGVERLVKIVKENDHE